MRNNPPMLVLAPEVMVRPMAEGTLVVVGDQRPVLLDALHERIVAVCSRATERPELLEVFEELSGLDSSTLEEALDQLVSAGVLLAT